MMGIFLCKAIFSLRVKIKKQKIRILPCLCLLCLSFLQRFKYKIFTPFWGLESTADEEQHTMPAGIHCLDVTGGSKCWGVIVTNSHQHNKVAKRTMVCQNAPAKAFLIQILAGKCAISSNTLCKAGLAHRHETRTSADKRHSDEQENRALISEGKKPCWHAWRRRTESERRKKLRRTMWGKCQH